MKLYGNAFNDKYRDTNISTNKNNMRSFIIYRIYWSVKYNKLIFQLGPLFFKVSKSSLTL